MKKTICALSMMAVVSLDAMEDRGLFGAIYLNNSTAVSEVLANGASVNARDAEGTTPLHGCKSPEIARILVEKGADVNAMDKKGRTPLHAASFCGELEIVKFLVENGAYVNARDAEGTTPLHFASVRKLETVNFLVNKGAEVNAQDINGATPFFYAEAVRNEEIANFLRYQTSICNRLHSLFAWIMRCEIRYTYRYSYNYYDH